jgi:hypothetical protein
VSLDTFHACGVDADNRLYCWGRNIEGQLGTGDNDDRLVPTPIDVIASVTASATGVRQVVVGRFSSCAVTTGDRIYCTGENNAGQLGLGLRLSDADAARRNAFTEVAFP